MVKGEGRELKARTHTATFITLVMHEGEPRAGRRSPEAQRRGAIQHPKT